MRGSQKVIDALNALLTGELTAADQYFTHSQMYRNWGFHQLFNRIHHEWQEELDHAKSLIDRILFLEGTPDVASREKLEIGKDVPEMLKNDLASELRVGAGLKKAIAICEQEKDFESRRLLVQLLEATEEDHTLWLEQQLHRIKAMGIANYLQMASSPLQSGDHSQ